MRAGRAQEKREAIESSSTVVEDGFTLVEVLISLTILSLVMFLVVGGMNVLVLSSALNRKQGTVGAVVRRAAEAVRNDAFVQCTGAGSLNGSSYSLGMPATANLLPENAIVPRVTLPFVVKITSFDGKTTYWSPATGTTCDIDPKATQVVQIEDDSNSGSIVGATPIKQILYVVKVSP